MQLSRTTASAKEKRLWSSSARPSRFASSRSRTSTPRGGSSRRDRGTRQVRNVAVGDRGSSTARRAESRCSRIARPPGCRLPGDRRGRASYERAEIKMRSPTWQAFGQPVRHRLDDADREQAAARVGTRRSRASPPSRPARGSRSGRHSSSRTKPACDPRRSARCRPFTRCCMSLMAGAMELVGVRARRARLQRFGLRRRARGPSGRSRPAAGSRTSRSSSASRGCTSPHQRSVALDPSCRRCLSTRPGRLRGEEGGQVTLMNAAQRKGLEFRCGLHDRPRGGIFPTRGSVEEGSLERAPPLLRRHVRGRRSG